MDSVSEQRLSLVHPLLSTKVRQAYILLQTQGITIRVVQGLRTMAEQNADYAQGRTTKGSIITNAKGGQSYHNYGLAVDAVPGIQGLSSWQPNWNPSSADFKAMIKTCVGVGLEAGALWTTMKNDYDHFQMPGFPNAPTAEMLAALESGGTAGFWAAFLPVPIIG